jgi:putative transposase
MLTVVPDPAGRDSSGPASLIDEIVREGARAAQDHRRMVNAPHLVALVRAGARFERGMLLERESAVAA